MEKYQETLHHLTWPELLQQISAIIARDEKSLESNVNYYLKLFNHHLFIHFYCFSYSLM